MRDAVKLGRHVNGPQHLISAGNFARAGLRQFYARHAQIRIKMNMQHVAYLTIRPEIKIK